MRASRGLGATSPTTPSPFGYRGPDWAPPNPNGDKPWANAPVAPLGCIWFSWKNDFSDDSNFSLYWTGAPPPSIYALPKPPPAQYWSTDGKGNYYTLNTQTFSLSGTIVLAAVNFGAMAAPTNYRWIGTPEAEAGRAPDAVNSILVWDGQDAYGNPTGAALPNGLSGLTTQAWAAAGPGGYWSTAKNSVGFPSYLSWTWDSGGTGSAPGTPGGGVWRQHIESTTDQVNGLLADISSGAGCVASSVAIATGVGTAAGVGGAIVACGALVNQVVKSTQSPGLSNAGSSAPMSQTEIGNLLGAVYGGPSSSGGSASPGGAASPGGYSPLFYPSGPPAPATNTKKILILAGGAILAAAALELI